jgi:amino acid adenylation domain-containing protein
MAGLLAIIQVGACFMPLDPSYPTERLRYMLADSAAPLVLTDAAGAQAMQPLPARCVRVDIWLEDTAACAIDLSAVKRSSEDALYVMYTSGSTGLPKGVVGLQGATLNRLHWMWRQFPFTVGEVACQKTSPSFVDSIWEMLGPLLAGVPSLIIPRNIASNPVALVDALAQHKVTRIVLVPGLLKTLLALEALAQRLPLLWQWTVSGEALPRALAEHFRTQLPQAHLLNLYGATEVAADVTYWELAPQTPIPETATLPMGFPIDNVNIYLLDEQFQTVADGDEGEVYVSGAALAGRYLHRPELTQERFLHLPAITANPVFRTGDMARRTASGVLVFTGRVDDQVKISGVRVEPGEVERALLELPGISDAAVIAAAGNSSGELHLCAYLVARPGTTPADVQQALCQRLEPAAVPEAYIFLAELPRTPSGKIARGRLVEPLPVISR